MIRLGQMDVKGLMRSVGEEAILKHVSSLSFTIEGEDVAQLVEHQTSMLPVQVRIPDAARDFSPRVNFQSRLLRYL